MRVGVVGAGPWAQLLAKKFTAAGCEIVAHDRASAAPAHDMGDRVRWTDMFAYRDLDIVVAAGPPQVTYDVAVIGAALGLAVFAAKPLMLTRTLDLLAPLYVDYVRLWSPCWHAFKNAVGFEHVVNLQVEVYGEGPVRDFSSLLDYGSHALAFVHDLLGNNTLSAVQVAKAERITHADYKRVQFFIGGQIGSTKIGIRTGNGWSERRCWVQVQTVSGKYFSFEEKRNYDNTCSSFFYTHGGGDKPELSSERYDSLGAAIVEFCEEARTGEADPRLMLLTLAVTDSLRKIQQAAASGP